jgi:putative resolvase
VRKAILYARVSCHDRKPDPERQKQRLLTHAAHHGRINVAAITALGSGKNCPQAGLLRLLGMVVRGEAVRVVVENKDRLLRFGTQWLAWLCAWRGGDLVVVAQASQRSPASDPQPAIPSQRYREAARARDVLAVISVFSWRLDGARSAGRRRPTTHGQSGACSTG